MRNEVSALKTKVDYKEYFIADVRKERDRAKAEVGELHE